MFKLKKLAVSTVLILSGCVSFAPEYQQPDLPVPQQFSLSQNRLITPGTTLADSRWQTFFAHPAVRAVIASALAHNPDLTLAALKVEEARAQLQLSQSNQRPQLDGETALTRQQGIKGDAGSGSTVTAALTASYELDLFGQLKNLSEADRQNLLASEQARRAVQIALIANVAQSYFNQQLALNQLAIARQTWQSYQQSYHFVEQQLIVGGSNLLAVEQARGVIDSAQADIEKRQGELAQANNALQLLVGYQAPVTAASLSPDDTLHQLRLPAHLSSAILRQRPDIMEAEHQLKAADANIGAARAAFYPAISLTSGLSTTSDALGSLFSPVSGLWNFIPKITIPIFNGSRNESNLQLATIRQQQAVANYQKKIQLAFREVADALSLRDSLQQQINARQRYLKSLEISRSRAQRLYSAGAISYIEVLDAERQLFATQQTILDLKYSQQVNEINLFVALGGGWAA